MDLWVTQLCTEIGWTALFDDAASCDVYVKAMRDEYTNIKYSSHYDDGGGTGNAWTDMSQGHFIQPQVRERLDLDVVGQF